MGHIIKPVLKAPAGQTSVDVPDEVREEIETFYAYLTEHPKEEGMVTFDLPNGAPEGATKPEELSGDQLKELKHDMTLFANQARTYGRTREAGAIKYRQLPSKNFPVNVLRFQLTADLPENASRNSQDGPVAETPATTEKGKGKTK